MTVDRRVLRPLPLPALALIVMAGTWALLTIVVRWPMDPPLTRAALETWLLTGAVMLTWREAMARVLDGRSSTYAVPLAAALAVLFSPMLLWVAGAAAAPLLDVVLVILWIPGLRGLVADCRLERTGQVAAAVVAGASLGLVYFLYVNTTTYVTVFTPEQTLLGTQHRDGLYQGAIAAMLRTFGVPSTGLDGPVLTKYHFLSHALIGELSRWSGVAPLHAFVTYQILSLPLLLFSLSAATWWLRRDERTSGGLAVLLIPVLLLLVFEPWDWQFFLRSESYALSLTLLLLALPLLMELQEEPRGSGAARLFVIVIAGLAIVLSKNAVGAIFVCGVLFAAARAHGLTSARFLVLAGAVIAVCAAGVVGTLPPGHEWPFRPLQFVDSNPWAAWPIIIVMVPSLAAGLWLWTSSAPRVRARLELLAVLAVASLGCGLLLDISGGAVYYFMNVGVWISIVLVAGGLILPPLTHLRSQGAVTAGLAAAAAAIILVQPLKRSGASRLIDLAVSIDAQVQQEPLSRPDATRARPSFLGFLSADDAVRPRIAALIRQVPGARMQEQLLQAARGGSVEVVFVPPANETFWRLNEWCLAQPFFVPGLAGLPMVRGLPPERLCPLPADAGYGYAAYGAASRSAPLSDAELCADLRRKGFRTALVLESAGAGRIVSCR